MDISTSLGSSKYHDKNHQTKGVDEKVYKHFPFFFSNLCVQYFYIFFYEIHISLIIITILFETYITIRITFLLEEVYFNKVMWFLCRSELYFRKNILRHNCDILETKEGKKTLFVHHNLHLIT